MFWSSQSLQCQFLCHVVSFFFCTRLRLLLLLHAMLLLSFHLFSNWDVLTACYNMTTSFSWSTRPLHIDTWTHCPFITDSNTKQITQCWPSLPTTLQLTSTLNKLTMIKMVRLLACNKITSHIFCSWCHESYGNIACFYLHNIMLHGLKYNGQTFEFHEHSNVISL